MDRNFSKKANKKANQSCIEGKRTQTAILDEYKIISMKLFKQSDSVATTYKQQEIEAAEQAKLLDEQQSLLIEAQSMEIQNGADVFALLELWKADEIYNDQATPSQGIVLHLRDYFKQKIA